MATVFALYAERVFCVDAAAQRRRRKAGGNRGALVAPSCVARFVLLSILCWGIVMRCGCGVYIGKKFEDGWVEFLDKKIARSVARDLNAQQIGMCCAVLWSALSGMCRGSV